jgi:hypothetical protein
MGNIMLDDEKMIRELYATAEGDSLDMVKFLSFFSEEGYMRDIPTGTEFRGKEIAQAIGNIALAFPDIHREIFEVYLAENAIVVELAIQGTNMGELILPGGTVGPTGKVVDVPCCDVFRIERGKVTAFHCYNAASMMQQQLGLSDG